MREGGEWGRDRGGDCGVREGVSVVRGRGREGGEWGERERGEGGREGECVARERGE